MKSILIIAKKFLFLPGYLTNGMPQKAIDLFFQIKNPDRVCFSILFNACAQLATSQSLTLGKQVLSRLPEEYRESDHILYSLSNMFIKCNDLINAESLFNRLNRNVKSYGSLMKLYQTRNEPEKIFNLFQRMKQEEIQADGMIYVFLIDACSAIGDLSLSESIIPQIPKSFLNNRWIQTSSINMWVSLFLINKKSERFISSFFCFRVNVVQQNKPNVFLIVLINQMRFLMQL